MIEKELQSLDKCIKWYRQRAKTAVDIELVVELEDERDRFYEDCVCGVTDEKNDVQVVKTGTILSEDLNISSDCSEEPDDNQDGIETEKKTE